MLGWIILGVSMAIFGLLVVFVAENNEKEAIISGCVLVAVGVAVVVITLFSAECQTISMVLEATEVTGVDMAISQRECRRMISPDNVWEKTTIDLIFRFSKGD